VNYQILIGDVIDKLTTLADESVHCVVTSPPYWGLRDYGVEGQIGLEPTPALFLAKMVEVFHEVRRVLRKDGTCWVNMGDSYNAGTSARRKAPTTGVDVGGWNDAEIDGGARVNMSGLKLKDLCGMPWRLAFALQDDGWYLRQDIIWSKPNPMPESVTDRCTKAHEYLFLLTKSARYFYDAEAIKEPAGGWNGSEFHDGKNLITHPNVGKVRSPAGWKTGAGSHGSVHEDGREQAITYAEIDPSKRNKRSVWEIATEAFPEAHFATFPRKLVEPCIRAGCPPGGTVLDPFNGSGTTGLVAIAERCSYIGIELNPEYAAMSERRLKAASAQEVMDFQT